MPMKRGGLDGATSEPSTFRLFRVTPLASDTSTMAVPVPPLHGLPWSVPETTVAGRMTTPVGAPFNVRPLFVTLSCSAYTPLPIWIVSPGHATSIARCSVLHLNDEFRQKLNGGGFESEPAGST